jgi:hypothetical protein
VAQQRFTLMKKKGTFMKSQGIDHKIVAMKAEMVQLKGKLVLSTGGHQEDGRRYQKATPKEGRSMEEGASPGRQTIDQTEQD